MGSNRNSLSRLMGMQMEQPLWKTLWQFLIELNILLSYDLAIVFLEIYPQELKIYVHTKICMKFSMQFDLKLLKLSQTKIKIKIAKTWRQ